MSISPSMYSSGELLRQIAQRRNSSHLDALQKQCENCGRGMYKTEYGKIQCENCEVQEDEE